MLKRPIIACIAFIYTVNCSENTRLLEASASVFTAPLEAVNYEKTSHQHNDNPQTTGAHNGYASRPNLPAELQQTIIAQLITSEAAQNSRLLHFLLRLYTLKLVSKNFSNYLRSVCSDVVLTNVFERYLPAAFIPHKGLALTIFRNIGKKIVGENGTVNKAEKEFALVVNSIHENWEGNELEDDPFRIMFTQNVPSLVSSALCCAYPPLARLAIAYCSSSDHVTNEICSAETVNCIAQLPTEDRNQALNIIREIFCFFVKKQQKQLITRFREMRLPLNIPKAAVDTTNPTTPANESITLLQGIERTQAFAILQEVIRHFSEEQKQELKNRFNKVEVSLDVQSENDMSDELVRSSVETFLEDETLALSMIETVLSQEEAYHKKRPYETCMSKESITKIHCKALLMGVFPGLSIEPHYLLHYPLWQAAKNGDKDSIAKILCDIENSNISDEIIGVAIFHAVVHRHRDCVEILLQMNPATWVLKIPLCRTIFTQDNEIFNMIISKLSKNEYYAVLRLCMNGSRSQEAFISTLCTKMEAPPGLAKLLHTCARGILKHIVSEVHNYGPVEPKYALLIMILLTQRRLSHLFTPQFISNAVIETFLAYCKLLTS